MGITVYVDGGFQSPIHVIPPARLVTQFLPTDIGMIRTNLASGSRVDERPFNP